MMKRMTNRPTAQARALPSSPAAVMPPLDLEAAFPTVARFVEAKARIEGWVVRAIDYGGLIFKTKKARCLTKAMAVFL